MLTSCTWKRVEVEDDEMTWSQMSPIEYYKGRSTLVPIVPKITARWRQM